MNRGPPPPADWCPEGISLAGKLYAVNNYTANPLTQQQCVQWCRDEAACIFVVYQPGTGTCQLKYDPLM